MMFSEFRQFHWIFVVGPHRSGTTIAAEMIHADTGHRLILEDEFGYSKTLRLMRVLCEDSSPAVVQCPFLTHLIHDLPHLSAVDMSRCLVVYMLRDIEAIKASEKRAKFANGENVLFQSIGNRQKQRYHSEDDRHISEIRAESWQYQKDVIPNWHEQEYEDLCLHELWIDTRDFSLRQTSPDKERQIVSQPKQPPILMQEAARLW